MQRKLAVAHAPSAKSRSWKTTEVTWEQMTTKLRTVRRSMESVATFRAAPADTRSEIKDAAGGYVGGYLPGGRRKAGNVAFRSLLTLDLDTASPDAWDKITAVHTGAVLMHSTHSHTPAKPKFRIILPIDRDVSPVEYEAVGRKFAEEVGMEMFDPTTFQPERLMYWPSCPSDGEFVCQEATGAELNADEWLAKYIDWKDVMLWPGVTQALDAMRAEASRLAHPSTKPGLVGGFCRAWSIEDAIAEFLPDIYAEAPHGRYTYVNGTASGGLVVYEGVFAYSHHGTDPAGGKLCNAFDLVRLHKYADMSEEASQKAMLDFVSNDPATKQIMQSERVAQAREVFTDVLTEPAKALEPEQPNDDWMADLEVDRRGKVLPTSGNVLLILEKDPKLAGRFKLNDFDQRRYVRMPLPWRDGQDGHMGDVDASGLRVYFDVSYGISSSAKIEDGLALVCERHKYNAVTDYLEGCALNWDGKRRIDSALPAYLGCEDTAYTSEVLRILMYGAVARAFTPGIKFDLTPVLVGEQGDGKSTFLSKLGGEWYSDSFSTVGGKEAFEQLQGAWIIEIPELSAFNSADAERIKHFMTKQRDQFRPAYGRYTVTLPRRCVTVGTTNNKNFLRDKTGNRRFLPVLCDAAKATLDPHTQLEPNIVAQMWGEAVAAYRAGGRLYMQGDVAEVAKQAQAEHMETDLRIGLITQFCDMKLPSNWVSMGLMDRRFWMADTGAEGEFERTTVTAAEIWVEALERNKSDMTPAATRDINYLLRQAGWVETGRQIATPYGRQRAFERKSC